MTTAGLERFAAAAAADPALLDRYCGAGSVGTLADRLRADGYDVSAADLAACRTATADGVLAVTVGAGLRLALPKPEPAGGAAGLDDIFSHLRRHMVGRGSDER